MTKFNLVWLSIFAALLLTAGISSADEFQPKPGVRPVRPVPAPACLAHFTLVRLSGLAYRCVAPQVPTKDQWKCPDGTYFQPEGCGYACLSVPK